MPLHFIGKQELALLYFPDATPHVAVNHLNSWIRRCKELYSEMYAKGDSRYAKFFTPRQVALIYYYLGEPGK